MTRSASTTPGKRANTPGSPSALCLATLRPDGWAGYEPIDKDQPATIRTTPVRCTGRVLSITADAASGAVRVTAVDINGNTLGQSKPVTGDVTDSPVAWRENVSNTFISCHVEGEVRLSDDIMKRTLGGFYDDKSTLPKNEVGREKYIILGQATSGWTDALWIDWAPNGYNKKMRLMGRPFAEMVGPQKWVHVALVARAGEPMAV